ncbi:MBL fold metallo-hydrolase [Maribius pontilimi]|uniref:MBL fold metallo-hydrolase n=1 Tax=Palleronia pontilimi TaxID=1964209 RepID=A0A934MG26_9RHOB|nr:MBL fold metallo-hydrolase [Palleronia pontilimi]MBJ3761989.1 MBL fold metallo-hydrolase [Palleronia pontilimi]
MSTATTLEPGLRVLRAPNPSPMTHTGTNTYLLGDGPVAVIDPGPDSAAHLGAILAAATSGISHILVTHAHLDHSPLARALSSRTGAPVLAFGDARAGRAMSRDDLPDIGGGEGVDHAFAPDHALSDGDEVAGSGWTLRALWTPGHFGNHLSFAWGDTVFTGDLVMGWASTMVSPPDGDLGQFMASCERLARSDWRRFFPGHGDPIDTPLARLDWLLKHRRGREAEILACLEARSVTPMAITTRIYDDISPALRPAALRNVLAHLIDLEARKVIAWQGSPGPDTHVALR